MELIRGPKPYTEIEKAVATEAYLRLKAQIYLSYQLNPRPFDYGRGNMGYLSRRDEDLGKTARNQRRLMRKYALQQSFTSY